MKSMVEESDWRESVEERLRGLEEDRTSERPGSTKEESSKALREELEELKERIRKLEAARMVETEQELKEAPSQRKGRSLEPDESGKDGMAGALARKEGKSQDSSRRDSSLRTPSKEVRELLVVLAVLAVLVMRWYVT